MTTAFKSLEAMLLQGRIEDLALIMLEATYGRRTMGSSGPPILSTSSEHILRKLANKKLRETWEEAIARHKEASIEKRFRRTTVEFTCKEANDWHFELDREAQIVSLQVLCRGGGTIEKFMIGGLSIFPRPITTMAFDRSREVDCPRYVPGMVAMIRFEGVLHRVHRVIADVLIDEVKL